MSWEMTNDNGWFRLTDHKDIKIKFRELCYDADLEVLGFMEHKFDPQGYTAIWLLGESHLAVHTFDEEDKTYWELTSCNKDKSEVFVNKLKIWLRTSKVSFWNT